MCDLDSQTDMSFRVSRTMRPLRRIALLVSLFLYGCGDSGCINPDEDGTYVTANTQTVKPIASNAVIDISTSDVEVINQTSKTLNRANGGSVLKGDYTEQAARTGMWTSFTAADNNNDIFVYQGNKVKTVVTGSVLLKGFRRNITIPAVFDMIAGGEYYIPMVRSGIRLKANTLLNITIKDDGKKTTAATDTIKKCINDANATTKSAIEDAVKNCEQKIKDLISSSNTITSNTTNNKSGITINGVELTDGLGVVAMIYKAPAPPLYSDSSKWMCNTGFGSDTAIGGWVGSLYVIRDDNTRCAVDYLFGGCDDIASGLGLCAGAEYNVKDVEALNKQQDYIAKQADNIRQRQLFWVRDGWPNNNSFFARGILAKNDRDGKSKGLYYTGGRPQQHRDAGSPLLINTTCRLRVYNPWSNIQDFALCTYNRYLNGWAASQPSSDGSFHIANIRSLSPVSGWYFATNTLPPGSTCQQVDQEYNISNHAATYGGLTSYTFANSNIFWGSPETPLRVSDCTLTSCYITDASDNTETVQPLTCPVGTLEMRFPLQYMKISNLLAMETTDSGFEHNANCMVRLTINDRAIPQVKAKINSWDSIGPKLKYNDKVNISVSGTYYQGYKYHGGGVGPAQIYNESYGRKNCSATTAFSVNTIPFVSCVSGYKSGCSNSRVQNLADCVTSTSAIIAPGSSKVISTIVGQCYKTTNNNKQLQAYKDPALPLPNTLQDAGTLFTTAENVRIDHCGVCVKNSTKIDNNGNYIVTQDDLDPASASYDQNITIISKNHCNATPGYFWLDSYVDGDTKDAIKYSFSPNIVDNFCPDSTDSSTAIVQSMPRPLKSIFEPQRISGGSMGDIVYGAIGGNKTKNITYEIPADMNGATIDFGIAGNGPVTEKMFSEADKNANGFTGENPKSINVEVSTGIPSMNGKYLFFYIQSFAKDANGNETDKLDPDQDPNKVFKDMTHDQIYLSNHPALYDYTALNAQYDGTDSGSAIWRPKQSGKLWSIILDRTPAPGTISNDSDGRVIEFDDTTISPQDDGVQKTKNDLSNVLSWNTGSYDVQLKAQTRGQAKISSSFLDDYIVEPIKNILFGNKNASSNCVTYATIKPAPVTNTVNTTNTSSSDTTSATSTSDNTSQTTISATNIASGGLCVSKNDVADSSLGSMISKQTVPGNMNLIPGHQYEQYYHCDPKQTNNGKSYYDCMLQNKDMTSGDVTTLAQPPKPLQASKYGSYTDKCKTSGSCQATDMIRVFKVYGMKYTSDIQKCLRTSYQDSNCWQDTNTTIDIPYPFDHTQTEDFVSGGTMPPCNNDPTLAYKRYTNCQNRNGQRFCDIERSCYPGQAGAYKQSNIRVPLDTEQNFDRSIGDIDNISNITCDAPLTRTITYRNCRVTGDKAGNPVQQCDADAIDQSAIDTLTAELKAARDQLAALEAEYNRLTAQINSLKSEIGALGINTWDQNALIAQINSLKSEIAALTGIITKFDTVTSLTSDITTLTSAMQAFVDNMNTTTTDSYQYYISHRANATVHNMPPMPSTMMSITDKAMPPTQLSVLLYVQCHNASGCGANNKDCDFLCNVRDRYNPGLPDYQQKFDTKAQKQQQLQALSNELSNINYQQTVNTRTQKQQQLKALQDQKATLDIGTLKQQQLTELENQMTSLNYQNQKNILETSIQRKQSELNLLSQVSPLAGPGQYVSLSIANGSTMQLPQKDCQVERICTYYKNTAADNTNNIGGITNNPKVQGVAPNTSQMDIRTVCDTTRDWTTGMIYAMVTALTGQMAFQAIFYLAFILIITLKGYGIIVGTSTIKTKEILVDFIKMGLVFMLVSPSSWDAYQRFVASAIVNFTEGVNSIIASSATFSNHYTNAAAVGFGPVDMVMNNVFLNHNVWRRLSAIIFSEWYGIFYFLAFIISIIIYVISVAKALSTYVTSLIMMALLLSVGPLFIVLCLTEKTQEYFEKWIENTIQHTATQFGIFAMIAIFSSLYLAVVESMLYFRICFNKIIVIPIVDITILGWWTLSQSLPASIKYFLPQEAVARDISSEFPSLSMIAALILVVLAMHKFVQKPLLTNDPRGWVRQQTANADQYLTPASRALNQLAAYRNTAAQWLKSKNSNKGNNQQSQSPAQVQNQNTSNNTAPRDSGHAQELLRPTGSSGQTAQGPATSARPTNLPGPSQSDKNANNDRLSAEYTGPSDSRQSAGDFLRAEYTGLSGDKQDSAFPKVDDNRTGDSNPAGPSANRDFDTTSINSSADNEGGEPSSPLQTRRDTNQDYGNLASGDVNRAAGNREAAPVTRDRGDVTEVQQSTTGRSDLGEAPRRTNVPPNTDSDT